MAKVFNIVHKETGLTLKDYKCKRPVKVLRGDEGFLIREFFDEKITPFMLENGTVGFYYSIPLEGQCCEILSRQEWDVVFKDKGNLTPE